MGLLAHCILWPIRVARAVPTRQWYKKGSSGLCMGFRGLDRVAMVMDHGSIKLIRFNYTNGDCTQWVEQMAHFCA